MHACHECSLTSVFSPSNIQLACTDDCIAIPHSHSSIAVYNLLKPAAEVYNWSTRMLSVTSHAYFDCLWFTQILAKGASWIGCCSSTDGVTKEHHWVTPVPPGFFWLACNSRRFNSSCLTCWVARLMHNCSFTWDMVNVTLCQARFICFSIKSQFLKTTNKLVDVLEVKVIAQ